MLLPWLPKSLPTHIIVVKGSWEMQFMGCAYISRNWPPSNSPVNLGNLVMMSQGVINVVSCYSNARKKKILGHNLDGEMWVLRQFGSYTLMLFDPEKKDIWYCVSNNWTVKHAFTVYNQIILSSWFGSKDKHKRITMRWHHLCRWWLMGL